MKLIVTGYARHGKDAVCHLLDLPWRSSSEFAGRVVVWPRMPWYPTWEACFEDRHNHRELWRDLISQYNATDPARLCKEIFEVSDVYCGMRCIEEFTEAKKLADLTIWVDAGKRLGYNDPTITVTADHCDLRIDNNGSIQNLEAKVRRIKKWLSSV